MTKPSLSICIPCYQEPVECLKTVRSIRETSGDKPEIVVVDDGGGDLPCDFPSELQVKVIRNRVRIGSPAARHLAGMSASGTHILQSDCHNVFPPNWYESLTETIFNPDREKTVHCARMVALDREHPTLENHAGLYSGAKFKFCRDGKVLEAVWAEDQAGDDYELSAVMGSNYSYAKSWYLKLSPHRFLRSFSAEEEALSLKCWLSGGEVRIIKKVAIGHKFRTAKDRVPYVIRHSDVIFNRLFLILTCLPREQHERFIRAFGRQDVQFAKAMGQIKEDAHIVELERVINERMFTRSFEWLCAKFNL